MKHSVEAADLKKFSGTELLILKDAIIQNVQLSSKSEAPSDIVVRVMCANRCVKNTVMPTTLYFFLFMLFATLRNHYVVV